MVTMVGRRLPCIVGRRLAHCLIPTESTKLITRNHKSLRSGDGASNVNVLSTYRHRKRRGCNQHHRIKQDVYQSVLPAEPQVSSLWEGQMRVLTPCTARRRMRVGRAEGERNLFMQASTAADRTGSFSSSVWGRGIGVHQMKFVTISDKDFGLLSPSCLPPYIYMCVCAGCVVGVLDAVGISGRTCACICLARLSAVGPISRLV